MAKGTPGPLRYYLQIENAHLRIKGFQQTQLKVGLEAALYRSRSLPDINVKLTRFFFFFESSEEREREGKEEWDELQLF